MNYIFYVKMVNSTTVGLIFYVKKELKLKVEYDLKSALEIYLQVFNDWYYKHEKYTIKS